MRRKTYGRRSYLAVTLSAAMMIGSLPVLGQSANAWEHSGDVFQDRVIRRVMDGQTGGLQHYHYEDSEGNEVALGMDGQTDVQFGRKAAQRSDLPGQYDPRGTEQETPIRDQTDTGACWAFGALKSLEGNAIAQGLYSAEEADFSENHLAWYTYRRLEDVSHPLYGDDMLTDDDGDVGYSETIYDQGGNGLYAAFTLANGWGAAEEEDAPFSSGAEMTAAMEPLGDSIRDRSVMRLTSLDCYDAASPDVIKQEVLENGAVDVSLYYPTTHYEQKQFMYQDEETCSLYSDEYKTSDANHCVSIVGWDDEYDTFTQQPEQSGAWLIANSYGESANDGGYFWVSYYDTSLCEFYSFKGVPATAYTTTFQYDGKGWGDILTSSQDIRIANVFTNETDQPQELSAVSFYSLVDNQSYEVQIYRNLGTEGPLDGEWVGRCTTKAVETYSGYHTVSLQQPIIIAPGERFSAVVTFYPGEEDSYVALEGQNSLWNPVHYSGKTGQSYLYLEEEDEWYDTVDANYNNVCLKTLANPATEEAYQEQEKTYEPSMPTLSPSKKPTPTPDPGALSSPGVTATQNPSSGPVGGDTPGTDPGTGNVVPVKEIQCSSKITLGVGEKVALMVQIKPSAAKQTASFQSSNTKVVSVQKNGVLRAKKTGTARITVRASGVKKTVTVRVKKAPKSMKIIAGKKKLKKGKRCRLRVKFSKGSASYQLNYKSLNPKIVSVSAQGTVRPKKAGTARIRVTSFNGKRAYIKLKVVV